MVDSSLLDAIKENPVMHGLEPAVLEAIAEHSREVKLKRGVLIFRQETEAEHFYIVREGEVSVEIPAIYGAPITMQKLGPGEVVGWSWLFEPFKWHFDARATRNATLIEVDGKRLREHCAKNPTIGYPLVRRFASFMMERLNASRRKVMDLYGPEG